MTAELLKRVGYWHQSLAAQIAALNPQWSSAEPDRIARHLVLALLSLPLYHQRGLVTEVEIQTLSSYDSVRSRLLQVNHHYGQLFPIEGLPAHVAVDDMTVTAALQELKAACFRVEFLAQAYEGCLGRSPTTPNSPSSVSARKSAKKLDVKKSGAIYYTPRAIADYIVQQTVGRLLNSGAHDQSRPESLRILDPSCGGGMFLLTAYRLLLSHAATELTAQLGTHDPDCTQLPYEVRSLLLQCIYGVDIDLDAVMVTRLSLLLVLLEKLPNGPEARSPLPDLRHTIRCGNSVIGSDWQQPVTLFQVWGKPFDWQTAFAEVDTRGGFDAVIGNPPYLDSEWMTAHLPQYRRYCTRRYRVATGNWDLFCVFIEQALTLCRPGGLTSLVVPNKLASAEYAKGARSLLTQTAQLLTLRDYSRLPVFAAAVYPLVYVAQKSPSAPLVSVRYEQMRSLEQVECWQWLDATHHFAKPNAPWPLSVTTPQANLIAQLAQKFSPLGTLALIKGAATVAEAYALQPLIQEWQPDDASAFKLVNSGTLDRYRICWGEKRLRYLGASYLKPVIAGKLVEQLPRMRQQQAKQPKILIAGIGRRLECALDATGAVLAAKSTCIIQTSQSELDLRYLLGILNSQLMQVYFTQCFAGNALQGGYLRVGPPQLRQLPIPAAQPDLRDRLIALVDQMLDLCDRAQSEQIPTTGQSGLEAIAQLDHEIDQLVYKIYQLSLPEIASLEQPTNAS